MIYTEKIKQRKQFRKIRQGLSMEYVNDAAEGILENLNFFLLLKQPDALLVYHPLGKEASLLPFVNEMWDAQVEIAFPRVEECGLRFYTVDNLDQLEKGSFDIMEPKLSCKPFEFEGKEIAVLTPGVVFDEQGSRMGYGKGYYDSFFTQHPEVLKIGIAYEAQMADKVVSTKYDIKMDLVITDTAIYNTSNDNTRI